MAETLTVTNLAVKYGTVEAVRDVSFAVEPGEVFVLLGPSGGGKSTILRALAGYTPAAAGTIHIGDEDITELPARFREFGMVFQGYALFQHLTVAQNVAYGLRTRKVKRDERARRVEEILRLMELTDLAKRYPRQLSGGQQQRVALARALVIEPRVLLMDEPLSALDAKLKDGLLMEIRRIQQELGVSTVYVTHDQTEAFAIADRVAVVDDGRLATVARPEDLYRRPDTAFVARFVGNGTILRLGADNLDSGGKVSSLPGQKRPFTIDQDRLAGSGTAQVFLRPEAIRCSAAAHEGSTIGVVSWRRYRGRDALVGIDVAGEVILAVDAEGVDEGQSVHISWDPDDSTVIVDPSTTVPDFAPEPEVPAASARGAGHGGR